MMFVMTDVCHEKLKRLTMASLHISALLTLFIVTFSLYLIYSERSTYFNDGIACDHRCIGPLGDARLWLKCSNFVKSCQHRRGFFRRKIGYYSNHIAGFHLEKIVLVGIHPNPGPLQSTESSGNRHNIRCLYLNSRSVINKTNELQTFAIDSDLCITETWLKPKNLDCE